MLAVGACMNVISFCIVIRWKSASEKARRVTEVQKQNHLRIEMKPQLPRIPRVKRVRERGHLSLTVRHSSYQVSSYSVYSMLCWFELPSCLMKCGNLLRWPIVGFLGNFFIQNITFTYNWISNMGSRLFQLWWTNMGMGAVCGNSVPNIPPHDCWIVQSYGALWSGFTKRHCVGSSSLSWFSCGHCGLYYLQNGFSIQRKVIC